MTEQLSEIYIAFETQNVDNITIKPSYVEHIQSESEYLKSDKYIQDKEFWKTYIDSTVQPLSIKSNVFETDSDEAKRYEYHLSNEENEQISNYCQKERVSKYNVFMAGLAMYMARVNEKYSFYIGTPVLNRSSFKEKQTQGMFISTLPIKICLNNEETDTFLDVCKYISSDSFYTFKHSKYPYSDIASEYKKKNSDGAANMFKVAMSYQNARSNMVDKERFSMGWLFSRSIKEDLVMHILDLNDTSNLSMCIDYKTKLFCDEEIQLFVRRIVSCIMDGIQNNATLKDICIIPEEEKNNIIYEYNGKVTKYPKESTIIELLDEVIKIYPQNTAIVYGEKKYTYEQIDYLSDVIAKHMHANQVQMLDTVGIMLNKTPEVILSMIACLKLGCCFVPIDNSYNKERQKYMCENSQCVAYITDGDVIDTKAKAIQLDMKSLLTINTDSNSLELYSKPVCNALTPACILYTSGTTGMPKGAIVTNRNIIKLVRNTNYINILPCDKILQGSSTSFDVSLIEIWGALLNGACTYLIPKNEYINPILLKQFLIKNNITIVLFTSVLLNQMIESDASMFAKTRLVLTGGDVMSLKHIKQLKASCPSLVVQNCYGPTECATTNAYNVESFDMDVVPIGKPISNTKGYVLDSKHRMLPMYVSGEYVIAGDGVTAGYINNEAMTREKYILDNIDNEYKDMLMYRTGDVVAMDNLGNIKFYGRKDTQVKINGYRIELEEIKSAVLAMQGITDCIVYVDDTKTSKQLIVLYISLTDVTVDKLKKHLINKLAYFMVPKIIYKVDSFPMNVHGKVDVQKIKSMVKLDKEVIVDRKLTIVEKKLLNIFATVLKAENVSVDKSFFEQGGDSLLAISVVTKALNEGLNVTYSDLYKYASVEEIAKIIDKNESKNNVNYDVSQYDYSKISKLLMQEKTSKSEAMQNILLTGATGFLGVHILQTLVEDVTVKKIYCLIREKNGIDIASRLRNYLHYYFGETLDKYINNKIILVKGDIISKDVFANIEEQEKVMKDISVVINAAAYVKHYGNYDTFNNINYIGVQNLCELCVKYNVKLAQISTLSVSGNEMKANAKTDLCKEFYENTLYIGQTFGSIYSYTKFLAERTIFEYMITQKLKANIFRIGNLTGRYTDGKFQINSEDNAFFNRVAAFISMKAMPENIIKTMVEFSPVDNAAEAVVELLKYTDETTVYHIYNSNHISISKLIEFFKKNDIDITIVNKEDMSNILSKYIESNESKKIMGGLIEDLDINKQINYEQNIKINGEQTNSTLQQIGFAWPKINNEYIKKYIINNLSKKEGGFSDTKF